jgi:hypothetical protein
MTNDNLWDEANCFTDTDKSTKNIKHGYISITMLCSFVESFLNSILRDCLKCSAELLKTISILNKIEIIYLSYNKDIALIKGRYYYGAVKKCISIRNEMIHYKNNFIGEGTGVPLNARVGGVEIIDFFTKEKLRKLRTDILEFSDQMASDIGLSIYKDIEIFSCDGRDSLVSYIYDTKNPNIDQSRFD